MTHGSAVRWGALLWVLLAIAGPAGAQSGVAEFPAFKIDEFDEANRDKNLFEGEVPDSIDVPKVSQRVYGAEELQRLPVDRVVIEGVVAYPEAGITQDSVQELIDRRFREEQDLRLDDNGFTERDLNEIGRFLREMRERGGWDQEDLDNLVVMMDRQAFELGWITIEQLDAIALSVTEFYRERGFILATAFVPEQEVSDGIIRLNVLEGRLGNVTVSNNSVFTDATISAAFAGEVGQPVTDEKIEGALRRINDLPGVRVRGSFSPGQNVGETSLNLGVLEEKAWSSSLVVDNHGSETTGEARLFATTQWQNIRNSGHRLTLGLLRSFGSDTSTYGLAEYEMPVTEDGRGKVRAGISSNQFSVSSLATLPKIVGKTNNFSVAASYQHTRSRTFNLGGELGYTQKDVLFDVEGAPLLSRDERIEVTSASINYNQLWDDAQLLVSGRVGIDLGHVLSGAVRDQSTNFVKTLVSANLLKRFSIDNWLTKRESFFNFVVRLNSQYSEKLLSSVEQFSLGGPNAVRAFGVSDVSVDSGAYAGFELFFDSALNLPERLDLPIDPIRPFVFFDYAYGVSRSASGTVNRDAILKGYGIGMRVNWPGRGSANLVFAQPRSASYDGDALSEAEGQSRVFIDVQYLLR